jgi:hypothetical protein
MKSKLAVFLTAVIGLSTVVFAQDAMMKAADTTADVSNSQMANSEMANTEMANTEIPEGNLEDMPTNSEADAAPALNAEVPAAPAANTEAKSAPATY